MFIKKYVLWFDISMNNILTMQIIETIKHLQK